ncbi:outer membrane protein assembly factor BamB family protein [Symbioplanes lichenis]|uniref:outer membrane protein assembly factor BamB family protein n=1 Tax=Symbioplanes lichenis TaxID=1629072 RepID=UPI00273873D0|nr:PQQ-binding-like beta-propeller repeat protein [Actinoplanes lichenis]
MSADLDQVFAELRGEADTVPLASPAAARRRGTRRTRSRSMAAAALAVCLVGGGTAWFLRPQTPARPAPTATTTARALPRAGQPVEYGGQARAAKTVLLGNSAYTVWQDTAGTVRLFAAPLDRPAAGPMRATAVTGDLDGAYTLEGTLVAGARQSTGYHVWGLDPGTGTTRWDFAVASPADLALFSQYAVHRDRQSGLITGLAVGTGKVMWTTPGDPGPGVPLLPVTAWDRQSKPASGSIGPVQPSPQAVTIIGGRVVALEPETGDRVFDQPLAEPLVGTEAYAAWDGRLFILRPGDRYEIVMTKLDASGESKLVWTGDAGRTFQSMHGCGQHRLCVADEDAAGAGQVTAVDYTLDTAANAPDWSAPLPGRVTGMAGGILVGGLAVTTDAGTALFRLQPGGFVATEPGPLASYDESDRSVLALPATAGGPVTRVVFRSGQRQLLGSIPVPGAGCFPAGYRLICPGSTSLSIFQLPPT